MTDAGTAAPSLFEQERERDAVALHQARSNRRLRHSHLYSRAVEMLLPEGSEVLDVDCGVEACRVESRHPSRAAFEVFSQKLKPGKAPPGFKLPVDFGGIEPRSEVYLEGEQVVAVSYFAMPRLGRGPFSDPR